MKRINIRSTLVLILSITFIQGHLQASAGVSLAGLLLGKSSSTSSTSSVSASATLANSVAANQREADCRSDGYKIVSIDIPGATFLAPNEINSHRMVTGAYGDALGNYHTFLWRAGKVVTIDNPQAEITSVTSINDNNILFGNWGSVAEQHAGYFELDSGKWVQLPDLLGFPINIGSRMNNAGHAVGYACRSGDFYDNENCSGWFWNGKKYTVYDFPGAQSTFPYGLDDHDREVGLWQKAPFTYLGFERVHGKILDLTLSTDQGLLYPTAYDVNNNGDVLAAAPLNPTGYWPSIMLHSPTSFSYLPDYPGVVRTFYTGMNEREDLVGLWFNDPSGFPYFGFVAFHDR